MNDECEYCKERPSEVLSVEKKLTVKPIYICQEASINENLSEIGVGTIEFGD